MKENDSKKKLPEEDVHFVNVSWVQSDGMLSFCLHILEG